MVIRSPGSFSPFRIIMITFFKASVFNLTSPFSREDRKFKKANHINYIVGKTNTSWSVNRNTNLTHQKIPLKNATQNPNKIHILTSKSIKRKKEIFKQ